MSKREMTAQERKEYYKKRFAGDSCRKTDMPFDVWISFIISSHPIILREHLLDDAFPDILCEIRREIDESGKPAWKQRIEREFMSYR